MHACIATQGVDGWDVDLPTYLEANIITTTLAKVLWVFVYIAVYGLRPIIIKPKPIGARRACPCYMSLVPLASAWAGCIPITFDCDSAQLVVIYIACAMLVSLVALPSARKYRAQSAWSLQLVSACCSAMQTPQIVLV